MTFVWTSCPQTLLESEMDPELNWTHKLVEYTTIYAILKTEVNQSEVCKTRRQESNETHTCNMTEV